MTSYQSYFKHPLTKVFLFVCFSLAMFVVRTGHASADCGVSGGGSHEYAGVIISSYWIGRDGVKHAATGVTVEIITVNPSNPDGNPADNTVSGGNIVRLNSNDRPPPPRTWDPSERVMGATFNQYGSGCGGWDTQNAGWPSDNGFNVVLGYGLTSQVIGRSCNGGYSGCAETPPYQWAIDCDISVRGPGGTSGQVGRDEQKFFAVGHGTPNGAAPGGTWTQIVMAPQNGGTQIGAVVYTEPPPPPPPGAHPPQGFLDAVTCDLNNFIQGWAQDPDSPGTAINVTVYVDGDSASSPYPASSWQLASGPRADTENGHGFNLAFSALSAEEQAALNNSGSHSIYVYAIGVDGSGNQDGTNALLGNSPMFYNPDDCTPPPPPDRLPTVTINPANDCSIQSVSIRATDPDYPGDGSDFTVDYSVDGQYSDPYTGAPYEYTSDNSTPFVVDLSAFSPYDAHYVEAWSYGVPPAGGSIDYSDPNQPVYSANTLYGIVDSHGPTGCLNRPFTTQANANLPNLTPDEEVPNNADFSGNVEGTICGSGCGNEGTAPDWIYGVHITRRFYIRRKDGITIVDLPTSPIDTYEDLYSGTCAYYSGPCFDINESRGLNPPPLAAGDKVCMRVTSSPASGHIDDYGFIIDGAGTSDTNDVCVTIITKPYFRTYGGDTAVGDHNAICGTGWGTAAGVAGNLYGFNDGFGKGAASQLATIALARINQFTTAAGYTTDSTKQPPYPNSSDLALANDDYSYPYGGNFATNPCPPDFFAAVPKDATVYNGDYTTSSTITAVKNAPQVIYARGDIHINHDTIYTDDASWQVGHIPSITFIAEGNIYIGAGVTQLSGLYVARQAIYTCTSVSGTGAPNISNPNDKAYLVNNCNQQLRIFGTFIAPNIKLLRTYKSLKDSDPNEPYNTSNAAEVFMFSPQEWLNNSDLPPFGGNGEYDSITSLPPTL